MDGTKTKVIEKITEKKTHDIVETGLINDEKESVIARLEKVLSFLKDTQINDVENLAHFKKPMDELESCLKYIPNGPLFNDIIPAELKENILSYLCESNAFTVASVCQEWKEILGRRFHGKKVMIGKECINCEGGGHVKPADMLTAAMTHKLDVHLWIGGPIGEVDSGLIADALTSVSKFTVDNRLSRASNLTNDRLEHLFESIEKGDKIMEEVGLLDLDLQVLYEWSKFSEERLASCLVNKVKNLTMSAIGCYVVDPKKFIEKLVQNTNNLKLTELTLDLEDYFDDLPPQNVADALCNVENVKLCNKISFRGEVMVQLVKNIVQRPVRMKTLNFTPYEVDRGDNDIRESDFYDFGQLINPQDLKSLLNKMENLTLHGFFTLEQLEAVRSVTDVEISRVNYPNGLIFHSIKKGSDEMFQDLIGFKDFLYLLTNKF